MAPAVEGVAQVEEACKGLEVQGVVVRAGVGQVGVVQAGEAWVGAVQGGVVWVGVAQGGVGLPGEGVVDEEDGEEDSEQMHNWLLHYPCKHSGQFCRGMRLQIVMREAKIKRKSEILTQRLELAAQREQLNGSGTIYTVYIYTLSMPSDA